MLLDFLGTVASLLATYYFIRLDRKAWLISLFATVLNAWLYWQKGIYADMALESFYFLSTCYGWYLWRVPPANQEAPIITKLSITQWMIIAGVISCLFIFIISLLLVFTYSDIALLDAMTTSLSLAAQWLMCYKMIATWILWFITDAIFAYMYFHKHIPFHCFLMTIYTIMAVIGYRTWARRKVPQTI
ncbi:nicotinamide riboside transporter PnuC [Legionella cardiaca]|uniref:Nicotinamide riboside transporter PnuC n=1 Tax=Legionella cardiaca TaxID=1071983 RepID=A0ABY8AUK9_9GAMM|nr:nicotinamide riboside transporter PnuC [Legionella cardiaca]WED43841.1 nicotinamide riboside transporter PnuC [Legionella cardiaca]